MTDNTGIVLASRVPVDKENDPRWQGLTYEKDHYGRVYTYDVHAKSICGAITRTGGPCRRAPLTNRNRCALHGGKSLRGRDHPSTVHMRYSRDLVGKMLADRYEEARKDPKLLELKDEISLVQARIGELLKSVDTGESLKAWKDLRTTYDELIEAHRRQDVGEAASKLNELGRIIGFAHKQYRSWDEIYKAMHHEVKLTEAERKRLSETKQMMTNEQAMNLLSYVVAAFKKRVHQYVPGEVGQELLAAIASDISQVLMIKNRPRAKVDVEIDADDGEEF